MNTNMQNIHLWWPNSKQGWRHVSGQQKPIRDVLIVQPNNWKRLIHNWSLQKSTRLAMLDQECVIACSPLEPRRFMCEITGTMLPCKPACRQRHSPCAHYFPITDQLLRSHSSRLQIRTVLEAYSSTSSLLGAHEESRAISPPGQLHWLNKWWKWTAPNKTFF